MKLIYLIPIATLPLSMLTSCGDKSENAQTSTGAGNAPQETKDSVRAKLPLYYTIDKVTATTSTQTVFDKSADVSQLALEVTLNEDLFIRGSLTPALQEKLNNMKKTGGFYSSPSRNKTYLKKVASKGDKKTLYGEMATTDTADGKKNIISFSIKDATGSPISAYNQSEVLIIGSEKEKEYVDTLIAENETKVQQEIDKKAKYEEQKRLKKEEETKRLQSIKDAAEKEFQKKKDEITTVFKTGASYSGVYKAKTGEKVTVEVVEFDPKFLHGILKVKSQEHDFAITLKISFEEKTRSSQKYLSISGNGQLSSEVEKNIINVSRLAANGKYNTLSVRGYSLKEDNSISIDFGNYGSIHLTTE